MKNIYKLLITALAILSLSSCVKDLEPTAYLTENKKNEIANDDPEKEFAAGIYTEIQSACASDVQHNYFGQKSFDYLTSLMGNDMPQDGMWGMSWYHYSLTYWGETRPMTYNRWVEYYTHIASANSVISTVVPEKASKAALSYYAQAKAARGYAYFQLASLYQRSYYCGCEDTKWGKGETYDWSEKPCVPLLTEETNGDQPRSSVKVIYNQIISDLSDAIRIFDEIGSTKTATTTDFDGCVAALYLARTYMNMHEWEKAQACAQIVIDNYDFLRSKDQILQGFSDLTLPDVVFGCDITADNSTIYMSWFSQMDMFGDGYACDIPRIGFKPLVDRIADNDIRLEWFLCDRSEANVTFALNKDIDYQSCKFIGCGRKNLKLQEDGSWLGTGWELGDYIYLRSEEAYFIKMECLAHLDNVTDAKKLLVDLMKTRQPDYTCTLSATADVIEEINYQKRVEFWGEGIEFLDNRRLNIPVDRTDETWGAENNNHYEGAKKIVKAEDMGITYQLPIDEIENNKQLTPADQNK